MFRFPKIIAVVGVCFLSGCATAPKDPNITTAHRWIGGAISLEARKTSPTAFTITAKGAGACREDQVMRAWVEMAEKLAGGIPYEKTTAVDRYNYKAPTPYGGATHHSGYMITGEILLK